MSGYLLYTADCSTVYRGPGHAEVDSHHFHHSSVHRRWIVDWYNGIKYICRNDAIHDHVKLQATPVLSSLAGSGPGISCSVSPPRSAGRLTPAQEQHKSATFTKFARMLHVLCLVLVLVRLPERKSITKQSVDRGLVIIIIM